MSYNLKSNNFVLFQPSDRQKDGIYCIPGGVIHVFAFQVIKSKIVTIATAIIDANSSNISFVENSSLHMWFSKYPLDHFLFTAIDWMNPIHLSITSRIIRFSDKNTMLQPTVMALDSDTVYYVNVKNMQASEKTYNLQFQSN